MFRSLLGRSISKIYLCETEKLLHQLQSLCVGSLRLDAYELRSMTRAIHATNKRIKPH